jgi:hypothetical protein
MFWDGITGDGGPYSDDDVMDTCFRALLNSDGNRGVLYGWRDDLDIVTTVVDIATIMAGGAVIYGLVYDNTAPVNVDVSAYRGATCRIVVRRWWVGASQPPPGVLVEPLARIHLIDTIGGEAFQQVVGDVYDIPLYLVSVDGVGNVSIAAPGADQRDYCVYSSDSEWTNYVSNYITVANESVTTAKLVDQDRWVVRGAGTLQPDATNPATWTNLAPDYPFYAVRRDAWLFEDGVWREVWCSFRVPADCVTGNMEVFLWLTWYRDAADPTPGLQRWGFNAYSWRAGVQVGPQADLDDLDELYYDPWLVVEDGWHWIQARRFSLGTFTVVAGDLVNCSIYRDATVAIVDTSVAPGYLLMAEFKYTADS